LLLSPEFDWKELREMILNLLRIFFIIFFCLDFFPMLSYAQKIEIDSLEQRLDSVKGVEKSAVLRRLIYLYQYSNMEKSMRYVDEAISICEYHKDSSALMRLVRNKAQLLTRQGQFHLTKPLIQLWLPFCKGNNRELGIMLSLAGLAETMQGNYASALEYLMKAAAIPPTDKGVTRSAILNNIGLVYYKLRDFSKAEIYFSKASSTFLTIGDFSEQYNCYFNLGLVYSEMGKLTSAEGMIRVGMDMCGLGDANSLLTGQYALGIVMLRKGDLDESEKLFQLTLKSAEHELESRYVAECLVQLAQIKLERSRILEASSLLTRCEFECVRFGYKEILLACYKKMVTLCELRGDLVQMEKYQGAIIKLGAMLHGHEVLNSLSSIESDFRRAQSARIILHQHERVKLMEAVTKAQNNMYMAMLVFCFILLLLIVSVYRGYRARKVIYRRLLVIDLERNNKLSKISNDTRTDEYVNDLVNKLRFSCQIIFDSDGGELSSALKSTRSKMEALIDKLSDTTTKTPD
jgi:tetratricopeptide (TPR) repeat protein